MKIAILVARVLLGLVFFVFGLNHIVPFMPAEMPSGDAGTLSAVMFAHKWFVFYGLVEAAAGLMLLLGRFVPLGLTLIGAVGVNILLFVMTLLPSGIAIPLVLAVLEAFLIYAYRKSFAGIFQAKAEPTLS